jgi:hypothetical protein
VCVCVCVCVCMCVCVCVRVCMCVCDPYLAGSVGWRVRRRQLKIKSNPMLKARLNHLKCFAEHSTGRAYTRASRLAMPTQVYESYEFDIISQTTDPKLTGDSTQPTADSRHQTADSRHKTADGRQPTTVAYKPGRVVILSSCVRVCVCVCV